MCRIDLFEVPHPFDAGDEEPRVANFFLDGLAKGFYLYFTLKFP
jgi:hypothetical protein